MSKTPFVSVIIVNYNGRSFVGECIKSVLKSDYSNFEIVMVDNASTDGSYDFIKEMFVEDKRLKLTMTEKQLFFTGGSNLGAINAKGEKLLFLNSDTIVDKNWIKELISFTNTYGNCLVQPKILTFQNRKIIDNVGGNYNFIGFGSGKGRGEHDNKRYDHDSRVDFANGTCFMIDKKLFYNLGGFDEWYKYHYEDVDLSLRAKKWGVACCYCYKSIIYHKGSLTVKSQLKRTDLLFNIRKNRLRTVIKNFDGFQRLAKVMCLFFIYSSQIVKNLIVLKPTIALATLSSIAAVVSFEHKMFVNKIRLWELVSSLGKKHFNLLDLGCGDGTFIDLALKAGVNVLGVEVIPRVHNKIIGCQVENYKPAKTNEKYDVVSLYHVIEHLREPKETLINIRSWIKPEGLLVVEVPLVGNLSNRFLGNKYFAYNDKGHQTFLKKEQLLTIINQSGWAVIKRGFTLLEFPFTVITTAFRKNMLYGLFGLVIYLPLKLLSIVGFNVEIIRVYCRQKEKV